jgi:Domain of unknown function (DUF5671)
MSTTPDELTDFVRAALARGMPRPQIEAALRNAGWTVDQTRSALAGFADVDFPIPVPRPRPYLDAREAFVYLVLFSTLYISAYYLGALLFDIINSAFPDPAEQVEMARYRRMSMRWAISWLVVAFPVFLYMSRLAGREIAADPNKRQSKVRRWLTYITLFVASGAIIGDVAALVYNVLGGEITVRFLLKVLVVAFIAGSAFWYYLTDIRREE